MNRALLAAAAVSSLTVLHAQTALAMCGCFIPPPRQQEMRLVNETSKVVIARDGDRTVITMSNDFKGETKEFAIVIPVPTFIEKEQIHVGDAELFAPLESWSAPKLIEPLDNPCDPRVAMLGRGDMSSAPASKEGAGGGGRGGQANPVTVEASYTVGEYDIVILSATQSDALETWLNSNGYKVPKEAGKVFKQYVKQKMRFFVAKANLSEQNKLGFKFLRPLQLAYETPKFMLPIRLGMVNSDGPQELTIYALTRKGRVETTNYRTVKIPTGMTVPVFVKNDSAAFYKAMFREQSRKEDMSVVFVEYAAPLWGNGQQFGGWANVGAVAQEPTDDQLKKLGVFWTASRAANGLREVHLTRLHFRYDDAHFPEDLVFQETSDAQWFQASYNLLPQWSETATCLPASERKASYGPGEDQAAQQLARLTGWDVNEVRRKMKSGGSIGDKEGDKKTGDKKTGDNWYEKIWDD